MSAGPSACLLPLLTLPAAHVMFASWLSQSRETRMALMLSSLSAQAYMVAPMVMPTVQRADVNMAFIDTL